MTLGEILKSGRNRLGMTLDEAVGPPVEIWPDNLLTVNGSTFERAVGAQVAAATVPAAELKSEKKK